MQVFTTMINHMIMFVVFEECHLLIVTIFMTLCLYVHTPCADVPLIPSNVMRAVREVKRWSWGEGGTLGLLLGGTLADLLSIPQSKQDEIRRNFPDEMEQKRQAISYWINTDPLASWRRLITALDEIGETKVADSIRSNAEPLTGIVTMYYYCMFSCTVYTTVHYASHYTMYTALVILTLSEYQYRLYVGMAWTCLSRNTF